ncbi:hypothetical protein MKleb_5874 (plasmid) [Klebsiella sp. PL-2018]|nr:hypothetical protein MKleb_5874 [Klebsiella sp. PL-2018]
MADLHQVVFRQTGHFNDGIAVNAVLQHGTGNFEFACLQRIVKFIQPADGIQRLHTLALFLGEFREHHFLISAKVSADAPFGSSLCKRLPEDHYYWAFTSVKKQY